MRGAKPERSLEKRFAEVAALEAGEVVVAATSGGSDSGALAALLTRTAAGVGARVVLAHVNHAVRSSAWQDEAIVLALGSALHARALSVSLAAGSHAEARLRDERYAALGQIARQVGARRVFTAHHARDQTESVLLALFRGAGPSGLGGMQSKRELEPGIALVRPLLGVEPAELRAYLVRRQLPFALDPQNGDLAYRRNAVRSALTELRKAFPHLDAAVARCASIARQEREALPRALVREGLRRELWAAGHGRDLTFERLDAVARALGDVSSQGGCRTLSESRRRAAGGEAANATDSVKPNALEHHVD